ncbi:hypothetical protein [Aquimarina aggregata]|uniref:hypothetical protein n=1 Tax=Aquimarina aggregata TaxID=1642818 RepID=UPI00248F7F9B|nr:hypothetical protein [Aquimarina aggregata]
MIKNILGIVVVSVAMLSCKDHKKANSKINDSISVENQTPEELGLKELKGSGSEPGWNIIISKERDRKSFSFILITMLGERKTIGNLWVKEGVLEKDNSNIVFTGSDSNEGEITVMYLKKSCLDIAGNDLGGIIEVQWDDQILKGCAELLIENKK